MTHIFEMNINELLVFVLHIVDLALIGNLVLMILFYQNMTLKEIKIGQNFWVIPLIFTIVDWQRILIVGDGDLFMGFILGGFTYYFWGLGSGRIIDKDVKPFKVDDNDEEE